MTAMTTVHFEPFVHLAGLTHDDALVAWGGFFFRDPDADDANWGIVEDPDLGDPVSGPGQQRTATIGANAEPYGAGEVQVFDARTGRLAACARTTKSNHVWVRGLTPDTEYTYRVLVDGEPWAEGPRRGWLEGDEGPDLRREGRAYDNRFRTFPSPDEPASLRFAVLGDYGVGILSSGGDGDRQRRLAAVLERAVDHLDIRLVVTTGDNIYLGDEDTVAGSGDHDDDWYYSFYEPYRYVINRVPVYPGVGNHDTADTESSDDRDQLNANFYTTERFAAEAEVGRASVDPGLFYRFSYGADIEFVAVDTTLASSLEERQFFEHPRHRAFLERSFPERDVHGSPPPWRIPFTHHPPFCAGPSHDNMQSLIDVVVPLWERSGTRLVLSGHEHNFQHAERAGIHYVVSGAGAKLRTQPPDRFDEAHTRSWAAEGHLLVIDVREDRLVVHPVTEVDEEGGMRYLQRRTPGGQALTGPIEVRR